MSQRFGVLVLCALVSVGSTTAIASLAKAEALTPPVHRFFLPVLESGDVDRSGVDALARGVSVALRQMVRRTLSTIRVAVKSWTRYAKRGARWIALAFLVGILDRNLLAAWRSSGLWVLTTYVPLMLYVNVRLFLDRRVFWLGKLLLVSAIAYGVWRHDFIPDRAPFPGYVEDIILVTLATRLFLAWSGDDVVFEHASAAVQRWDRMVALQR